MPTAAYASKESEYWYNVSPQEELPLAGIVERNIDLVQLLAFFQALAGTVDTIATRRLIQTELVRVPALFPFVRQFLGISDKRAYLDLSYLTSRIAHPELPSSLCGCQPWTLARHPMDFFLRLLTGTQGEVVQLAVAGAISDYLITQKIREAAIGFTELSAQQMEDIYVRLVAPKEFQQKAAKRRGHGCEAAAALALESCGVAITPTNKTTNPMGANDPHLNLATMQVAARTAGTTHAFDILVSEGDSIRIALQSLIHTSDPGQFGVDKSNETVEIYTKIKAWNENHNPGVELWALLDGVGFSENKTDTINKLLRSVDHFIQLKTLYKAPLRLHTLGLASIRAILFSTKYDNEDIREITRLYVPEEVDVLKTLEDAPADSRSFEAGYATIFM